MTIGSILFDRWSDLGRILFLGLAAYLVMVIELRISGKRTLAKLNAFDLVVTVALGSVLATIALSREVSLADGVTAITVLVGAQWLVSWASVHVPLVRRLARAEASVVVADGRFLEDDMAKTRLTRSEILQAVRASGHGDLESVAAVVLETDGALSVIATDRCGSASTLPCGGDT